MKRIYIRPKSNVEVVMVTTQIINASGDMSTTETPATGGDEDNGDDNLTRPRSGFRSGGSRSSSSSNKGWGSLW